MLTSGANANTGYMYGTNWMFFISTAGVVVKAAVYVPPAVLSTSAFRLGVDAAWNNTDSSNETTIKVVGGVATARSSRAGAATELALGAINGGEWYILEILFNSTATAVVFNVRSESGAVIYTATITTNIVHNTNLRSVSFSATSTTAGAKNIVALDYIYAEIPTGRV